MENPYTSSRASSLAPQTAAPLKLDSGNVPRSLSPVDSIAIVVGVIIGATLYESTPRIAAETAHLGLLVLVWLAGGLLAFLGALCYAELATTYPQDGGSYVYLVRAFGRRMGFVYAWAELWVVRPGSIGAMAFVFGRYANELVWLGDGPAAVLIYAAGAIVLLTMVNLLGLQEGKWTQNLLTAAKVLGLLLVVAIALAHSASAGWDAAAGTSVAGDYELAFILVMFAYGGWNELGFVAAEVRQPQRNVPRTMLLGVGIVTAIYVLANVAFAWSLGWDGFRGSDAVAADVVRLAFGDVGSRLISALVCVSTLGAINGQIFTGARIYYAFGRDHAEFGRLGEWNRWNNTPFWSLVAQAVISLAPVIVFGLYEGAFNRMVIFTTPVFWFFFLLVGASLFVLRRREPHVVRPFRVPLYPVTPLLFCASSGFMMYSSFNYAQAHRSWEALWAVAILAIGFAMSWWRRGDAPR